MESWFTTALTHAPRGLVTRTVDDHDHRFDRLDGQLAEVLGILREER